MADTYVIELKAGKGEPASLELRPGVELAPLSVGTGGAWQISASGVRAVHLYLYFDGQTLFLQSPDGQDPPLNDGRPIPASWTPARAPCTISFGQAQLAFHAGGDAAFVDDERTVAQPLPDKFRNAAAPAPPPRGAPNAPARPFKPGAFAAGADDESTRLQPLEDFGSGPPSDSTRIEPLHAIGGPAVGAVRPAAGTPWNRAAPAPPPAPPPPAAGGGFHGRQFPPPPPAAQEPPTSAPGPAGPPSGLLNVPPPSVRKPDAPETFQQKVQREWAAASPLRRALFATLPVAVLLALWLVFAGGEPPPPRTAAVTPSATTTATPPVPTPTIPPAAQDNPAAWPPVVPPLPPPPPPVPPGPRTNTPQPVPSSSAAAAGGAGDAGAVNSDRRQRQAGDAVATHQYDVAIRLYDELAAEHPQNPAFHEAARILRGKLASGTP